jgi:hypothetical protein
MHSSPRVDVPNWHKIDAPEPETDEARYHGDDNGDFRAGSALLTAGLA